MRRVLHDLDRGFDRSSVGRRTPAGVEEWLKNRHGDRLSFCGCCGFGNGDSLADMAAQDPARNWLGIEVHRPGVGHLLLEIERRGLTNLRLIRHDAVEVLREGIAPAALDGVQLFFPDPWHKRRHHKRRILSPALMPLLARAIRSGGIFHAATDWEPYAEQMLETLESIPDWFENAAGQGQFAPRPAARPLTKFEQRGERLGHRVHDLLFRRR